MLNVDRVMGQVLFFLILAFANCVIASTNVPVLIWNNDKSDDVSVPAVSALQQISVATLQAQYFDAFKPDNVLLFVQDALSIEDLSSHVEELTNVNRLMDAGRSLYLPNVAEPIQLQHNLVQQGYKVFNLAAGTAISELPLDASSKNLVVVKLPPTMTSPSRSRAIRKSGEVMESVLSKIGGLADFTVVYTGLKPSVASSETVSASSSRLRVSRSLQQLDKPELPSNLHNGSCVLIYFRENMQMSLNGSEGPFDPIPENTFKNQAISHCDEQNQTIRLNYDDVKLGQDTYSKLKITFFFYRKGWYWRSPTAEVILFKESGSSGDRHALQLSKWLDDSVPVGKSYACSVPLVYTDTTTSPGVQLVINGVQVQAFFSSEDHSKFGPVWDCVGFFTIGIWSGLFAGFIALLILGSGLAMLANIKTMDRFDDPKGKTIMVPQTTD